MAEQHFGSELVAIEVEIGFMETKVKQKNERETQPKRTSPFSLILFAKVVARQTKGKMIVDGVNIASMNFLDETQSTIHFCDPTHRGVTRQEITVFSLLSKVYRCQ